MNNLHVKQHQRIIMLTIAVFFLALISIWQQGFAATLFDGGEVFQQEKSFYALCTAFVVCMITALTFIKKSSSDLKTSSKQFFIDELTGLENQHKLKMRLKQAHSLAIRDNQITWVMKFNLDNFSDVNDCYGRDIGDLAIKEFSQRLCSVLQQGDDVLRTDDGDIVTIVSGIENEKRVEQVAELLAQTLRQPLVFADNSFYCGVSIGATAIQANANNPAELIKQANYALLQAKNDGRNQLKIFEPNMAKRILEKHLLGSDLRSALKNNEIYVEYQPTIAQNSGKIVGSEALVRWIHPTRGVISPEEFIPIAEETGIIHELGEFVLLQACTEFQKIDGLKLAVNVSPVQFQRVDFVDKVKDVLKITNFDPQRLEIEITEGIFISDPKRAADIIKSIKSLGVKVALDDFGTGYSSLSYLKDFSFDRIKIDRSFIKNLDQSKEAAHLVSIMIGMGESQGFEVTVEGIETPGQLDVISKYDHSEMQGFLFSKPVGIGQFKKLCDHDPRQLDLVG